MTAVTINNFKEEKVNYCTVTVGIMRKCEVVTVNEMRYIFTIDFH